MAPSSVVADADWPLLHRNAVNALKTDIGGRLEQGEGTPALLSCVRNKSAKKIHALFQLLDSNPLVRNVGFAVPAGPTYYR